MLTLKLDKDSHVYTLGDREVPGVTSILKDLGIIDDTYFNEQARIRGSYIHEATQFFDEEDLDINGLDPALRPYLHAYERFKIETGFRPDLIEHGVYARDLDYAGTIDRTGEFSRGAYRGDSYSLVDIKSGAAQQWVALQLAAYKHALLTDPLKRTPDSLYSLQLKADGSYLLTPMKNNRAFEYWISVMNVYNYKRTIRNKVYG
jgi:hypothetical protein